MSASSASLFSRAAPLHTSFDGAQVLWFPALRTALKPKLVLIFVAGNPGLASFYTPFLATIHRHPSLRGRVEIVAVSHRGHALVPPAAMEGSSEARAADEARHGIRTSLYDQVRHKVDVLDAIRRVYPRVHIKEGGGGTRSSKDVKIVLVGHSIGAYICLEMLRARRRDIDGVHLLFPTLSHIARTPNAQSLRLLLHPLTATLLLPLPLLLLSFLPALLLIPLIRLLTMQPASAAQSTAELLLTRGAVVNALAMARDEMRIVQGLRPEIKDAVQAFARRQPSEGGPGHIRAYWGKGESDGWTPSWIRSQVEEDLRLERVTLPQEREDTASVGGVGAWATPTPFQTSPAAGTAPAVPTLRSRSSSMHLGGSPRRRTSTLILHGGLAHSLDMNGSPSQPGTDGTTTDPQTPPPASSMRLRKLSSAIAKRHIDGSITLERAVFDSDDEDGGVSDAGTQRGGEGGARAASVLGSLGVDEQAVVFDDPEEFSSGDEAKADSSVRNGGGGSSSRAAGGDGAAKVRAGRLTSTVCEVGMPHAFCLTFGTEMGNIVARWMHEDFY